MTDLVRSSYREEPLEPGLAGVVVAVAVGSPSPIPR